MHLDPILGFVYVAKLNFEANIFFTLGGKTAINYHTIRLVLPSVKGTHLCVCFVFM